MSNYSIVIQITYSTNYMFGQSSLLYMKETEKVEMSIMWTMGLWIKLWTSIEERETFNLSIASGPVPNYRAITFYFIIQLVLFGKRKMNNITNNVHTKYRTAYKRRLVFDGPKSSHVFLVIVQFDFWILTVKLIWPLLVTE